MEQTKMVGYICKTLYPRLVWEHDKSITVQKIWWHKIAYAIKKRSWILEKIMLQFSKYVFVYEKIDRGQILESKMIIIKRNNT